MNKLQEWEQRRRDMGLEEGYTRKPTSSSAHTSATTEAPMNKLQEWEQRRRDMGLEEGHPRKPTSPFTNALTPIEAKYEQRRQHIGHSPLRSAAPTSHRFQGQETITVRDKTRVIHDPKAVSVEVQDALRDAMRLEGVNPNEFDDLLWLVAQESQDRIDAQNKTTTARGLFQITEKSYYENPHGKASFGNKVEEAQGGIRYIRDRYGSAAAAKRFWKRNLWY